MTAIDPTSSFPTSVDTFPTIGQTDDEAAVGKEHWLLHNKHSNAIRAAQTRVLAAGFASQWRQGTGVPSNGLGADGDFYLNDANGDVYQRAAGVYTVVANLKGPAGTNGTNGSGAPGSTWRNGTGVPSDSTGIDGDYYLRTSTGDVYKRASGTYTIVGNILGPAGVSGSVWRDGVGAPSNGLGANGDYYLNHTNGDVFLRTAGAYSVVANIKGTTVTVPTGGTTGQLVAKASNADFDLTFVNAGALADSSHLPVPPATAAQGTSVQAARSDHVHQSSGLFNLFGDGSDGVVLLDGTNTFAFLTKSGNVYTANRIFFPSSLTVNSGVTLKYNYVFLHVAGPLINNGTISVNGSDAVGATGGAGALQHIIGNNGFNGANGGTGNGGAGVGVANPPNSLSGSSGAGGAGASTTGGAANSSAIFSGVLADSALLLQHGGAQFSLGLQYHASNNAPYMWQPGGSGGAGGGDGTNSGGGGGGGGGILIIFAQTFTNAGTVTANGGAGGTPTTGNCGGGGGGASGWILVNTTVSSGAGTVVAIGGVGGSGVGTGAAGSSAASNAGLTTIKVFA